MIELKPCPFCGGKAKISFRETDFYGKNAYGDKKSKYVFQVICNKCHSRGKPVKTEYLVNCNPWSSNYCGRNYDQTKVVIEQTKMVQLWADKAVEAWNRRAGNG